MSKYEYIKDKFGKDVLPGDVVRFYIGNGPVDPFGYWETGTIKYRNGIWMIVDGNYEWSAHGKELTIIERNENKFYGIWHVNVHKFLKESEKSKDNGRLFIFDSYEKAANFMNKRITNNHCNAYLEIKEIKII